MKLKIVGISEGNSTAEVQQTLNVVKIHDCNNCELKSCTSQPEVIGGEICAKCPISTVCCRSPLIALMPCETNSGFYQTDELGLKMKPNEMCYAYDEVNSKCSIHKNRPMACRVATCRFIETKNPNSTWLP